MSRKVAPEQKPTESKQPKLPSDPAAYGAAIEKGKSVLGDGGSKADAARAIHALIGNEDREVVLRAFVEGATITEKGAPTYFYNIERKARRKGEKTA